MSFFFTNRGRTNRAPPPDWPRSTFPPELTVLYPSMTSLVAGNTTGGGKRSLMWPQWVLTEGSVISQVDQFSMLRTHLTLCSLSSYLTTDKVQVIYSWSTGPYLSSNSVVPLSERPSSTRVRLDNLEYIDLYN